MDVYLDYNATAPLRPQAAERVTAAMARCGNASSVHRFGRLARRDVEDAREAVAQLVGAFPEYVTFTGGGTEANNMVLQGFEGPVFVSAVEHDSVRLVRDDAQSIAVDAQGVVDLDHLESLLQSSDRPALVAVMAANNETGVIQPIAEIVQLAHRHEALVHCDAVQAAGRLPLDFDALHVDTMSLSAHKIGGPQGVGALVMRENFELAPLLRGGGQERRRRAGTENVPGIAGFGAAAQMAYVELDQQARIAALRDGVETEVRAAEPNAVFHGAGAGRLANTTCIGLPGVANEVQVMTLDLAGIAVSAGSACSSGKIAPSHVLRAMGLDDAVATSAIRISLGWRTSEEDCRLFVGAWSAMAFAHRADIRKARSAA